MSDGCDYADDMIDVLTEPVASTDLDGLATLLMDAVASVASVIFMSSLEWPAARAWWARELAAAAPRGFTLVARDADGIAGCVVLKPAWAPNQPHRADVCKLLVHRRARGRGLARTLMADLERRAWDAGFTLLTLDTVPGRPADALYRSAGWTPVGVVPGYALDPDGSVCDTRIFYKAAPLEPVHQEQCEMTTTDERRDLVVTRVLEASLGQAWQAWSDPELVMRWWGPKGFTCPVAKMDFREGGTSLVCMRAPREFGGQDFFNTWTYEKIVPGSRFVYVLRFADPEGQEIDPSKQGLPLGMPKQMRHEVTFKEAGKDKTEVTVTEYAWPVGPLMEMSKLGLEQCLDKMAALFAK